MVGDLNRFSEKIMEEKALFEKVKQVLAQQLKIKDTDKITMESILWLILTRTQ